MDTSSSSLRRWYEIVFQYLNFHHSRLHFLKQYFSFRQHVGDLTLIGLFSFEVKAFISKYVRKRLSNSEMSEFYLIDKKSFPQNYRSPFLCPILLAMNSSPLSSISNIFSRIVSKHVFIERDIYWKFFFNAAENEEKVCNSFIQIA